jgi:hypothetical protein
MRKGRGRVNAFVAKLNSTGSALIYSTYLGGRYWDQAYGIAVDSSGNASLWYTGVSAIGSEGQKHPDDILAIDFLGGVAGWESEAETISWSSPVEQQRQQERNICLPTAHARTPMVKPSFEKPSPTL